MSECHVYDSSSAFDWCVENNASVEFHPDGRVTVLVGRMGCCRDSLFAAIMATDAAVRKAKGKRP